MDNEWKLFLDPKVGERLRQTVNDDANISMSATSTVNDRRIKTSFPAWNRICALMDRIEDTAHHLNGITLNPEEDGRCAFSFLDLMNHSCVLIDCVNEIARLYHVNLEEYDKSHSIFNKMGNDGTGSDKRYFEYLRSLCSVHPIETSHHRMYQDNEFECCPYVVWNSGFPRIDEPCNLYARVYTNHHGKENYKEVPIRLSEITAYIEQRYGLLDSRIIPGIDEYKESFRDRYRKKVIKTEGDFDTYTDYLQHLNQEARKRFGYDLDYYFNYIIKFLSLKFNCPHNQQLLSKYQNALKLATQFLHTALQNISYTGYGNNGIKYPKRSMETTLLDCLVFPRSNSSGAHRYGYQLSKISALEDETGYDRFYAMGMLNEVRPFLDQYVSFDEAKTDFDYFALTQLALYADCLSNKNLLNQNIPNDSAYRLKCLSDEEWITLHEEPETERRVISEDNKIKWQKLLKLYGS